MLVGLDLVDRERYAAMRVMMCCFTTGLDFERRGRWPESKEGMVLTSCEWSYKALAG
jgi:hypothetical protein